MVATMDERFPSVRIAIGRATFFGRVEGLMERKMKKNGLIK